LVERSPEEGDVTSSTLVLGTIRKTTITVVFLIVPRRRQLLVSVPELKDFSLSAKQMEKYLATW